MNISLDDFIDILFDKEKQEQFLRECEELGINVSEEVREVRYERDSELHSNTEIHSNE